MSANRSVCLVHPFLTALLIKPYRQALLQPLRWVRRKEVGPYEGNNSQNLATAPRPTVIGSNVERMVASRGS